LLQSRRFGHGHFAAHIGQTVISTAFVIVFRIRPLIKLDDESLIEQTPDGGVQGSGIQLEAASRAGRHILHDRVSMPIAIGERYKYVESRSRQGE
jgi:hypothetical protein